MGKEQIIDYVMNSPANTNKAVLEGMLDGMGGADMPAPTTEDAGKVLGVNESGSYALVEQSGGNCGYECTETFTEVFNDSLTTAAMGDFYGTQFTPLQPIASDSIVVTLNGTDYTLPKASEYVYGGIDENRNISFADYPCAISTDGRGTYYFLVPSDGTHQVVVKTVDVVADNITPCFTSAVKTVVESSPADSPFVAKFSDNGTTITPITSYLDVKAAFDQGRTILGKLGDETTGWLSVTQERYGVPVYVFGFLKDSITYGAGVSVEYIAVRLMPDNTIESETKTLAWAN